MMILDITPYGIVGSTCHAVKAKPQGERTERDDLSSSRALYLGVGFRRPLIRSENELYKNKEFLTTSRCPAKQALGVPYGIN